MGGHEDDPDLGPVTILFAGGRLNLPPGFVAPPMPLAPHDQLAGAARSTPAMARMATIVEWVGRGVTVDDEGELPPAAVRDLAGVLGIEIDDGDGDEDEWESSATRSEVALLMEWACVAGFVRQRGRHLYRTRMGRQLNAEPLKGWESAFDARLELGVVDVDGNGPPWARTVEDSMADLVVMTALRDGPIPHDELLARLWADEEELLELAGDDRALDDGLRESMAADARRAWESMADLGVVTVEEGSVASTQLGVWAAIELMRDDGVDVPVADI